MKRTLAILLALAMLLGCVSALAETSEKPVVKLGACFVESGGGSAANIDWVKPAVQLAVEEYNARPDAKFTLELVTRDCQNDSSLVGTKYSELEAEGCVGIVGPNNGSHGLAGFEWAKEHQLPVITTSGSCSMLMGANCGEWGFSSGILGVNLARVLAQAFMDDGNHSFYFVAVDGSAEYEVYEGILEYLDAAGYDYELLGEAWVSSTDSDYTAIVNAAMSGKPDAIFACVGGAMGVALLQQGQMYGMFDNCDIYTHVSIGSDLTMAFGDEFPEGVISYDYASWFDDSEENKEFYDWSRVFYEKSKVWPGCISIAFIVGAYTMIDAIDAAFDEATGTVDPAVVRDNIATMTFNTPIGAVSYSDEESGHVATYYGYLVSSAYSEEYGLAYGEIIAPIGEGVFMPIDEVKEKIASYKSDNA